MFDYRDNQLFCEGLPLQALADQYGTPLYVYSKADLSNRFRAYQDGFGGRQHLLAYSVKANSNLAILNHFAGLGAWFDIVSLGELERVLRAGGAGERVIFSGVGKQDFEIRAALDAGIACFNVESEAEFEILLRIGRSLEIQVPVAMRVNPDVDPETHPYISTGLHEHKFGLPVETAIRLYRQAAAMPEFCIWGISCHIGSQITTLRPHLDALERLKALVAELRSEGIHIPRLDLGGGLGVRYLDETPPTPLAFTRAVADSLKGFDLEQLILEPGRSLVAEAGLLLTRVILTKENGGKHFAVVDAAMNDMIRPALYGAWQEIRPVLMRERAPLAWDVVGPVCESGDFLGKDRMLALEAGDLLAVMNSGAYGAVMASNYNSRPRPAEVMVNGEAVHLVRTRERRQDLFRDEIIPD